MAAPTIPTELIAPAFNPATFGQRGAIHEIFRRLRAEYPFAVAEVPGFDPHWVVTKHADLREITRQDRIFHSSDRSKTLASQLAEQLMRDYTGGAPHIFKTLVHMDEPEHTAYRQVTQAQFMPQSLDPLADGIRATARHHVDRMRDMGGRCDFATEVAFLYPLQVIMDLIGVPREDHARMLQLTQWLFTYADPDLCRPGAPPQFSSVCSSVISQFKTLEIGQLALASAAIAAKRSASIPGTRAVNVSADLVTVKPSPSLSSVTSALVSICPSLNPARASAKDSAMVKQDACAAAISSSGLVPGPSSKREAKP